MPFSLVSQPVAGSAMLITRPGTAAPEAINAIAQLDDVGLTVSFRIRVDPGGSARVVELHGSPLAAIVRPVEVADGSGRVVPPGAITSRSLRGIRLDELAREALRQQERPAVERDDIHPGAFQLAGDAERRTWIREAPGRRHTQPELVTLAAQVYTSAAASGSRAPTLAVANALGYSRSQASRLIRQARDDGLIQSAQTAAQEDGKP